MKRGRKYIPHVTSKDELVAGLRFRPYDNRWVIVATGQIFSAQDEDSAIKKFRFLTSAPESDAEAYERIMPQNSRQQKLWFRLVADQIRSRPAWVAQQTGIEQIGYINDLQPEKPLPTFDELKTIWLEHFKKSAEQKRRVFHAWKDFTTSANATGLNDITPEAVVRIAMRFMPEACRAKCHPTSSPGFVAS